MFCSCVSTWVRCSCRGNEGGVGRLTWWKLIEEKVVVGQEGSSLGTRVEEDEGNEEEDEDEEEEEEEEDEGG